MLPVQTTVGAVGRMSNLTMAPWIREPFESGEKRHVVVIGDSIVCGIETILCRKD